MRTGAAASSNAFRDQVPSRVLALNAERAAADRAPEIAPAAADAEEAEAQS
jgi:hypothetical protein